MSCSTVSSVIALFLGVEVGNIVGNDVGDGADSVVVDGFGAGVILSSLSYYSMIVGVDDDVAVVLLMLGDGILEFLRPFLVALR